VIQFLKSNLDAKFLVISGPINAQTIGWSQGALDTAVPRMQRTRVLGILGLNHQWKSSITRGLFALGSELLRFRKQ
jgi:hypothetical protein